MTRSVKETHAYKKDVQSISGGKYKLALINDLPNVIRMLAEDTTLPARYRDHALSGNWIRHNECHIRPNFLLIYMKIDVKNTDEAEENCGELRLVRLGTHAEVF